MSLPPELSREIAQACARLGEDAFEIRELLQAGDVALALEVLVDQYDALGLPLPGSLEHYGWVVQLRSDLEELQELLEAEDVHRFDSAVLAVSAELDAALVGDAWATRAAADLLRDLFRPGQLGDFALWDEDPSRRATRNAPLAALQHRIRELAGRLR